jgi:hypothetical protein
MLIDARYFIHEAISQAIPQIVNQAVSQVTMADSMQT